MSDAKTKTEEDRGGEQGKVQSKSCSDRCPSSVGPLPALRTDRTPFETEEALLGLSQDSIRNGTPLSRERAGSPGPIAGLSGFLLAPSWPLSDLSWASFGLLWTILGQLLVALGPSCLDPWGETAARRQEADPR